ncbi:hypothetical protein CNX65_14635 [Actinosynnema pretiosum]|uniref:Uncharacterized protein n=1 Tax=Actinosynnema pretiosum TaxID=42197 RepID=A0A290Z5X8_9PSEU|nr:hypothetical protein CNX65_14635 [Actinosynnema pretiosum]
MASMGLEVTARSNTTSVAGWMTPIGVDGWLSWWLVAGGWWLVAGGWWLVAGGWWLTAAGRWRAGGRGRSWGEGRWLVPGRGRGWGEGCWPVAGAGSWGCRPAVVVGGCG